jgi:hypothetical protein
MNTSAGAVVTCSDIAAYFAAGHDKFTETRLMKYTGTPSGAVGIFR